MLDLDQIAKMLLRTDQLSLLLAKMAYGVVLDLCEGRDVIFIRPYMTNDTGIHHADVYHNYEFDVRTERGRYLEFAGGVLLHCIGLANGVSITRRLRWDRNPDDPIEQLFVRMDALIADSDNPTWIHVQAELQEHQEFMGQR